MQDSTGTTDEALWDELSAFLQAKGSERLLLSVARIFVDRILNVQMQRTGGNVVRSVSNAAESLQKMEVAIEQLHEHERQMDKEYFEELVKSDIFMIRGWDKRRGAPIVWAREGHKCKNVWRLQYGSPKAHAYIRYSIFRFQHAFAKGFAENGNSLPSGVFFTLVIDDVWYRTQACPTLIQCSQCFLPSFSHPPFNSCIWRLFVFGGFLT